MLPDYEGKDWNNETKEWLTMQFSRYPLMKQFYLPRTAEWRMIAQHIQEFIKGHEDGKG